MKKTIGIYHSKDLDGIACGAVIKHKFPKAELIGYDYGEPINLEYFRGHNVIMADVSLPMKDMFRLADIAESFIWIDHHRSAIDDFHLFNREYAGFEGLSVLTDGVAACRLTWRHLIGAEEPAAIVLLGRYDVWDKSDGNDFWEEVILPFQYGMRLDCISPETFNKKFMLLHGAGDIIDQTIAIGRSIIKYQKEFDKKQCEKAAFFRHVKGVPVICMNSGVSNSQLFDSVYNPQDHDMMLRYQFDGKKYNCSIYTTKEDVDCSAIAKSFGGGGHRKAAGFIVNDINEIFS